MLDIVDARHRRFEAASAAHPGIKMAAYFMSNKMIFKNAEADNWFRRHKKYISSKGTDRTTTLICEWLEPFKDNIQKIAEVGCGSGHRLTAFCDHLNAQGYGVEPSKEAVDFGNTTFENINLIEGFGDKLDLESESFDLVHLGFFLCMVDRNDYLQCIAEADRILKDGGFLTIFDFDVSKPYANEYHHHEGGQSFKFDNSKPFLSSGRYHLAYKHSFSHADFFFSREEDERISLMLLYKEIDPFPLRGSK